MKKYILIVLLVLLAATCRAENYYFLFDQSDSNRYAVVSEDPFMKTGVPYVVRLPQFQAAVQTETTDTIVEKPDWVALAQGVYTNGLTQLGYVGVWTNMDTTFEAVGASILQRMGEAMGQGDFESVNTLNVWKGLIKDTYETLLKYSLNYGITDMRLFPYESPYILSNKVTKTFIDFEGKRYYFPY